MINGGGAGFDPSGSVSKWLRNTSAAGALATWEDVLGGDDATAVATREPISNADGTVTFESGDCLLLPVSAATNSTPRRGVAFWFRPAELTSVNALVSTWVTDASVRSFALFTSGSDLVVNVGLGGLNVRAGSNAANLQLNTWYWVKMFYDGEQTAEADECTLGLDGSPLALTFSQASGTAVDMPDALQTPTGSSIIGCLVSSGSSPFVGDMGQSMFWLLEDVSPEVEQNLMGIDRPAGA
jgi:hypothetical protein